MNNKKERFIKLPKYIEKHFRRVFITEERGIGVSVIGKPGRGNIILRECKINWDTGEVEPTVFTMEFPVSILDELTEAIDEAVNEWAGTNIEHSEKNGNGKS